MKTNKVKSLKTELKRMSTKEMKTINGGGHWEYRLIDGKGRWVYVA